MKILVTGATGFIGNYVVHELIKRKYEVIATSSDMYKAKQLPWFTKITYFPFDLSCFNDSVNYQSIFNYPDIVIHLAWEGLPNYKEDFHNTVNLPRHIALLNNLIANGLKSLTVTGTCFEYGMQEGCLSEDIIVYPSNSYAIAKNELRKRLDDLCQLYKVDFKWVRLFYMYGKGQNPNSLFSQLERAISNGDNSFNMSFGDQLRDYLPVEKVAEYIVDIAIQNKVTGIINCCSGSPRSVKSLVEEYLEMMHSNIKLNLGYYPYSENEPRNFWGDTKKLNLIIKNA